MVYNGPMTKIIIGNWKMNPVTLKEAKLTLSSIKRLLNKISRVSVIICPPAIYLSELKKLASRTRLELGAQDVHSKDQGAETGALSAYMVRDLGFKYTIIGHSECRARGENDEIINQKILTALASGLRVILCLGEEVRDEGNRYLDVLEGQLKKGLSNFPAKLSERLMVAYEPVWAIGKNAKGVETPEGFLHNKIFIHKILANILGRKKALAIPVLYGGSVNTQNSSDFLVLGQADGLLVGRDSLNPKNFIEIIKIASRA